VETTRANIVLLHSRFKDVCSSAGDINLCSVCYKSLSDHESDTRASTSDKSGDMRDVEEASGLDIVVRCFFCRMENIGKVAVEEEARSMVKDCLRDIAAFEMMVNCELGLKALLTVDGALREKRRSMARTTT